jgi:hypothetical protein
LSIGRLIAIGSMDVMCMEYSVIPDGAQRRSGIQSRARRLLLDSGFASFARAPG